jgi:hypothetical protein
MNMNITSGRYFPKMSSLFQTSPEKSTAKPRFRRPVFLGAFALACGSLSILGAVIHSLWGPFTPSPTLPNQVVDNVRYITDSVLSNLTGVTRGKPPSLDATNIDSMIRQGIVLLSVIGMLMAMLAYVRRENMRLVGSALIVSGVAFATQYLLVPLILIGVVVVLMLIAAAL